MPGAPMQGLYLPTARALCTLQVEDMIKWHRLITGWSMRGQLWQRSRGSCGTSLALLARIAVTGLAGVVSETKCMSV